MVPGCNNLEVLLKTWEIISQGKKLNNLVTLISHPKWKFLITVTY